ncbi:MAG: glycosyltransferase [Alphaproteobacteria bacterium]|nr:glycosyltransferase [Alphaproteobacteria bacterium]
MTKDAFPIYVGWDSREDIAYQVCRHSLLQRASIPIAVEPLRLPDLRSRAMYWRDDDPLASTEFTYSRFLVPALSHYQGWALFCDCDFLWLGDVADLVDQLDDRFAVMCVQHDYRPTETVKMDGKAQTVYPRKNWSSLVAYNCGHPANAALTVEAVNARNGAYLHRFQWLDDDLIGPLDETWNWLEGWSQKPKSGTPNVVHYTRGGPWFENWQDVDYAKEWLDEQEAFLMSLGQAAQ